MLFCIEKAENDEKTHLLGFITANLVSGKIRYDDFFFFMNVVNNIQIVFLKQFAQMYTNESVIKKSKLYFILSSNGLMHFQGAKLAIGGHIVEHDTTLTDSAKQLGQLLSDYF